MKSDRYSSGGRRFPLAEQKKKKKKKKKKEKKKKEKIENPPKVFRS
jgi:hypothetical protein